MAKSIHAKFSDRALIEKALREAATRALRRHKKLGNSVVVSQDGKMVVLEPEDIVLPEEVTTEDKASETTDE